MLIKLYVISLLIQIKIIRTNIEKPLFIFLFADFLRISKINEMNMFYHSSVSSAFSIFSGFIFE